MESSRHSCRLASSRLRTTARLRDSRTINSTRADVGRIAPLARGRCLVRSTRPSKRRSQRSLAMQPAPLTARPPTTICRSRSSPGGAEGDNQRLQPAGINRIRRPVGLVQRSSSSQGPRRSRMLSTEPEDLKNPSQRLARTTIGGKVDRLLDRADDAGRCV